MLTKPYIRTASGLDVTLALPTAEALHVRDIAAHLAKINRFNGATQTPYSVAQHSLLVAELLQRRKLRAPVVLWGLLHDAHEAWLGDIATPVKRALFGPATEPVASPFDDLACRFDEVLRAKFHITLTTLELREVRVADVTALATEWRDLMQGPCPLAAVPTHSFTVRPLPWHRAEEAFLNRFNQLARLCGLDPA